MNRPDASSSFAKTWLARTALISSTLLAGLAGEKTVEANPGDQVVKITNPDAYLCTDNYQQTGKNTRLQALAIVQNATKPKGKDVSLTPTTEWKQKVSSASEYQDTYAKPITTYRQKYHVVYWPGDDKFEQGYYFINKDEADPTKKIALAMTVSKVPDAMQDLHIIEGMTPDQDIVVLGYGIYKNLWNVTGNAPQIPQKVKDVNMSTTGIADYKDTRIATTQDPKTDKTFLKRYQITASDIVEMESVEFNGVGLNNNKFNGGLITYKDSNGKETTYVLVGSFSGDFPKEARLYDITNFKNFKDLNYDDFGVCPDGRFEFKYDDIAKKTVITDTWNKDANTNAYGIGGYILDNTLAAMQGYDMPTFVRIKDYDGGAYQLIQVTSLNPLKAEVTEYSSAALNFFGSATAYPDCIPNPEPPPPVIETKPAVVEGAETSGAETATAETEEGGSDAAEGTIVEVVEKEQPDAGGETMGEEVIGDDADAIDGPEGVGNDGTGTEEVDPNDAQKSDVKQDLDAGPSDGGKPAKDAQSTDNGNKNDAGSTDDANGATDNDKGAPSSSEGIGAPDTSSGKPDTIASAPPSKDGGCSASPLTTRATTHAALGQLGLFGMTLAGAYGMRRRRNEQKKTDQV